MQVNYTSPAILGESFARGMDMRDRHQTAAIQREQAVQARAKYEDEMQFIPIDKIAQGVPPDLQEPMFQIAEGNGYISEINGVKGAHKYQLQNFMKDFAQNKLWQASVLESSTTKMQEILQPMKEQFGQVQQQVQSDLAEYESKIKDIKMAAAQTGKPVENSKIRAIEEQVRKYQTENKAFAAYKQLEQQITQLTDLHLQRINSLGMIEKGYEEDVKKYGKENALRLYNNMTSRRELDNQIMFDKELAKLQFSKPKQGSKGASRGEKVIKQLEAFAETHYPDANDEAQAAEKQKLMQLAYKIRNGEIDPDTVKFPSNIDETGRLVHKKTKAPKKNAAGRFKIEEE